MIENVTIFDYREIGAEQIDAIRPVWEKLKAQHVQLSTYFADRRAAISFDERRQELLSKSASGRLKVDVTYPVSGSFPVAYCVTSLMSNGIGEIDSIFVEKDYRGKGIGTELMRRALAWLDCHNAVLKKIMVAFGNETAVKFYRRFNFFADNISLSQISEK